MNENNIVNLMGLLRTIRPSQSEEIKLKQRVYRHVGLSHTSWWRKFTAPPLYVFSITGAIAILIVSIGLSSNLATDPLTGIRIAVTTNRLYKAEIALKDTTSHITKLNNTQKSPQEISSLTKNLTATNHYMLDLKLKGEPGKYTKEECLALYQKYYALLEAAKTNLQNAISVTKDPEIKNSYITALNQVIAYESQAEARENMY